MPFPFSCDQYCNNCKDKCASYLGINDITLRKLVNSLFNTKKGKIKYVDPHTLFLTEPPTMTPDEKHKDMLSYLNVLPSIALYGMAFVILVDECNRVIDGNYRGYSGLELVLDLVPISIKHQRGRGKWYRFIYVFLSKIRNLLGLKWFYHTNIKNPQVKKSNPSIFIPQMNILEVK